MITQKKGIQIPYFHCGPCIKDSAKNCSVNPLPNDKFQTLPN